MIKTLFDPYKTRYLMLQHKKLLEKKISQS